MCKISSMNHDLFQIKFPAAPKVTERKRKCYNLVTTYYTRNPTLLFNPFFSSPNVNFLFLFLVFFRFFHDILWPPSRPPHSVRGLPCAPRFPASNFWRNHNILSYFSASPCQMGDPNRSFPVFPQKMLRFSKGRCIILRQHEHLPFGSASR